MAEDVYGLTKQSAKLFKEMADRHRQKIPDTGRRTRRVFNQVGTRVRFYTLELDGTNVFGRKNTGGVLWEGQGKRIESWSNGEPDEIRDELETIWFKHATHIYVPGEYIPCVNHAGDQFPIGGGREVFHGCITAEDIDGSGNVNLEPSGSGFIVTCFAPITGEIVPNGTTVTVRWDHRQQKFLIDGTACPPST